MRQAGRHDIDFLMCSEKEGRRKEEGEQEEQGTRTGTRRR